MRSMSHDGIVGLAAFILAGRLRSGGGQIAASHADLNRSEGTLHLARLGV